jgi:hypothetical protein
VKRYVFFDPESGEIAHTHVVVSAETGRSMEVDDDQLAMLVDRMVDPAKLARIFASVPTSSGRSTELRVDPKRGRVVSRRIPVRERNRGQSEEAE